MTDKPAYKLDSNRVSTLLGASFILLGILFLIGRYAGAQYDIDFGRYTWPLFIIIPGSSLFLASFAFGRRVGIIPAIFGGVVTTTGAILLFQNAFNLFASWAYAWALVVPTSIGLAKLIYGGLRRLEDQVKNGLALTGIGLAIFILGGLFFELVIGINGFRFEAAWICWPALLIGLGIALLISNALSLRHNPSINEEEAREDEG